MPLAHETMESSALGTSALKTEATDAAAAAIVPVKHVRVDLINLRYAPQVRDASGKRSTQAVIHGITTALTPGTAGPDARRVAGLLQLNRQPAQLCFIPFLER